MDGLGKPRAGAVTTAVLLVLALCCLVTGALPRTDALAVLVRAAPVLGFVTAIVVVAELAREVGLLDVIGHRLAVLARGRTLALFGWTVALAVVSTTFFSLDTTAVILTPVVVLLARRLELSVVPFALATLWLANTASLVLPISNLTNLLARDVFGGGTAGFLAVSWAPSLAGILVPVAVLTLLHRRDLAGRYRIPTALEVPDRVLLLLTAVVVLVLLPVLTLVPRAWIPATGAAVVLLGAVAVRRRELITVRLVPGKPLLIGAALFVLAATIHSRGGDAALLAAAHGGDGVAGLLRVSSVAALTANGIDNLPAFLLLESAPTQDTASLMAVLIGVDAGAIVTPWASLATLLWHQQAMAAGARIPWRGVVLRGLVVAAITVPAATLALALLV